MFQLRRTFKKVLLNTMSSELVLGYARKKWLNNKVVILMYHELAEDNDAIESWTIVRKSNFIRQMEYLKAHFDVVSLEEAISGKARGGGQKPLAVVTFDDGYAGNKSILLPIAKSMDLPVAIFIATGAVISRDLYWYDKVITAVQSKKSLNLDLRQRGLGRYSLNRTEGAANWSETQKLLLDLKEFQPLERETAVNEILETLKTYSNSTGYAIRHLTEQEITEMSGCGLITFGAHSHCHAMLPQLTQTAITESVMSSKKLLEKWTGKPVRYFAYPSGAYDQKVIDILKEGCFECSLTTRNKPWDAEPLLEIPRLGMGRYDSLDLFKVRVSNALKL